ncbi:hypothetical protein, conserved [Leishmania tarentolae]|uniref:Uncharacterized protein n=1 Tax=Leishmania tarentolae TaxID=5689 RepID=A0A640KV77_LEITA|nr:hypothetical protein, conserved [Leishmania tarentolae]
MSEEKKPRFLQQTTSQLLHQQEALRKRREMLERESTKPPAMRFGTNTPPRTAGRHGRLPPPPSSACERHGSHSVLPTSSSVHRELNWSRSDDDKAAERPPMCFSMLAQPSPTPAVLARPRTATCLQTPPSPRPREVNTSDQVDAMITKLHRKSFSPRTVSPRSPVTKQVRVEHDGTSSTNTAAEVLAPNPWKASQSTAAEEAHITASLTPTQRTAPVSAAVELHTSTPKPVSREALAGEQDDVTGVAAFSNTFPLPRFTPISPIASSAAKKVQPTCEEKQSTPTRLAVGEFRTPRPVVCTSNAVTPVAGCPTSAQREAVAQQRPLAMGEEAEGRPTLSPIPVSLPPPRSSTDASADLEEGEGATSREDDAHTSTQHDNPGIGASREATSFFPTGGDASPQRHTPSPSRRSKASPIPSAQDLIHSVQASAEKRPCGCERVTPSPENWHPRRATVTPSRTSSPPPMPVPNTAVPITDFGAHTQKCCDRPTPASLSSQPAGGEVRTRTSTASSASPWPTTENIINSIMAGCGEGQRRGREDGAALAELPHKVPREHSSCGSVRLSNEETNVPHTNSHDRSVQETSDMSADTQNKVCIRGDALSTIREGQASPHIPSLDCHVSAATVKDSKIQDADITSTSSQPSASHFPHKLDVPIDTSTRRCKPAEGPSGAEKSGTGDERAGEAAVFLGGVRTPSPTPTPEHIIASLQASAEKRMRSGAIAATTEPKGSSASASPSPSCSSYQSPTLTPQNVKDSMQKLMREQQQSARSDAPAPLRPWTETSKGMADGVSGADLWNSSASPVVTAENVDTTLDTLERDYRYHSRSSRVPQTADVSPEVPNPTLPRHSVVSLVTVTDATVVEDISEIPAPSTEVAALASVVSPVPSELAVASAMFFDCVSAPPTPALENAEACEKDIGVTESVVCRSDSTHVPPQFYELQREVAAISEGRCRTRTPPPPPMQLCQLESPLPSSAMSRAEEDTPCAEASMEQAEIAVSAPTPPPGNVLISCKASPMKDAEEEEVARRSSLILVHPTTLPQTLLQHPHKPVHAVAAPSISAVQVPRLPTHPPPLPSQQHRLLAGGRGLKSSPRGELCESPLPRPVSLRSQVSLGKPVHMSHSHPHSHSPAPVWGAPCAATGNNNGLCETPSPASMQLPARCTAAVQPEEDTDQQVGLFDPKNDWMDLVEPLRPQTITVSPQGGTVVYTEHSSIDLTRNPEGTAGGVTPSSSHKRGRSAQTPLAASRQTPVKTPASIALSMDDGVLSGSKSLHTAATPSSHVSKTPGSSTRGRKREAQELLDMLPAEVVAEVARIESAEEMAAAATAAAAASADSHGWRPSLGSLDSRFSSVSDGDSTLGMASTISQRVSQRPRRVYHNYDYYIQYLEGIATSSAKKVRKAAGRRIHRAVVKDISSATAKTAVQRARGKDSPAAARISPGNSPVVRSSRSQSSPSRGGGSTSGRAKSSPTHSSAETVSVQSPSPTRGGGRGQLKVSTRLSAELQKALFKQPSPVKAKRQRSPRKVSPKASTKSTKAAKKSSNPAPKSTPSAPSTTQRKTAKTPPSSTPGKKSVKKFMTAKAMRRPRRRTKHGNG